MLYSSVALPLAVLSTALRCRVADAVANLGETEVREALLAKATFFVKVGDKVRAARELAAGGGLTTRWHVRAQAASEAAFAETESKVRRACATVPLCVR